MSLRQLKTDTIAIFPVFQQRVHCYKVIHSQHCPDLYDHHDFKTYV